MKLIKLILLLFPGFLLSQNIELSESILERNRRRILKNGTPIGTNNFSRVSVSNPDKTMSVYLGRTGFHDKEFEKQNIKTKVKR